MKARINIRWPALSLKMRLRISIVTLVTFLVSAQCLVSLQIAAEANFSDAISRADSIAILVRHLVLQRVNEQTATLNPVPATFDGLKAAWIRILEEDTGLSDLLSKFMASSSAVAEILVADETGRVLATSGHFEMAAKAPSLPSLTNWQTRPLWDRLLEVLTSQRDYAIVVPLGVQGQPQPVLTIRIMVSSILLREAIMPQVRSLLAVSLLSLIASMILAALFSNVVFASVQRLSARIEQLAKGEYPGDAEPETRSSETNEFAAMQSKLDLLGRQFRGAREDVLQLRGNIERMLERLEESVLLFGPEKELIRASSSASLILFSGESKAGQLSTDLFPPGTPLGGILEAAFTARVPARDAQVELAAASGRPVRMLATVELLENFPRKGQTGVLLTLRDAETRREIRSQLDISTRLTAISRLTGGVAHEIKNPLNAIALHLEILRSKLDDIPEMRPEVEVISSEISRLDRVVKTFLDFTRPVELSLTTVNLDELVRQVHSLVAPEAVRMGVSVEIDCRAAPLEIRADEDLFKQALLNVVNNGIEAMAGGGRLDVVLDRTGDEVLISVADQGPGIPDSVRDRIFNLYFTTKPRGSGIGLAMTFRIVQLHNGSIDFMSEPGSGTTFRMRFPRADDSLDPAGAGRAAEVGGA